MSFNDTVLTVALVILLVSALPWIIGIVAILLAAFAEGFQNERKERNR